MKHPPRRSSTACLTSTIPRRSWATLTMIEKPARRAKKIEDCKLAFIGDCHAGVRLLMFIASKMGMDSVHFVPGRKQVTDGGLRGRLDVDIMAIAEENCKVSGGTVTVSDDIECHKRRLRLHRRVRPVRGKRAAKSYMDVFIPSTQVTMEMMDLPPTPSSCTACRPPGEEATDEVTTIPSAAQRSRPRTARLHPCHPGLPPPEDEGCRRPPTLPEADERSTRSPSWGIAS